MSEYLIGGLGTARIALVLIFSVFYWLGGRSNKWLRRFLGPAILIGGICAIACFSHKFSPYLLISYPLYILAYSLGYSGTSLWQKVKKRAFCGLVAGLAGLPIIIIGGGAWQLFGIQMALAIGFSVLLGVFNPLLAAQEEGLIGFFSCCLVPFYL